MPDLSNELVIATQEKLDEPLGIDEDQVGVILLGVLGVFAEAAQTDQDSLLAGTDNTLDLLENRSRPGQTQPMYPILSTGLRPARRRSLILGAGLRQSMP